EPYLLGGPPPHACPRPHRLGVEFLGYPRALCWHADFREGSCAGSPLWSARRQLLARRVVSSSSSAKWNATMTRYAVTVASFELTPSPPDHLLCARCMADEHRRQFLFHHLWARDVPSATAVYGILVRLRAFLDNSLLQRKPHAGPAISI